MKNTKNSVFKLTIILGSYIVLDILTRLPYLNIFLSYWVVYSMLWAIVVIVYRLEYRWTFLLILIIVVATSLSAVFGRNNIAEDLGNFIYLLFGIGTTQFLVYSIKETKHK